MTPDERQKQKNQLRAIRNRAAEAPTAWKMNVGDNIILEASPHTSMNKGDPFPIAYATLDMGDMDVAQFLANAQADINFLLELIDRATLRVKQLSHGRTAPADPPCDGALRASPTGSEPKQPKNYSSQCAQSCSKQAFQKYIAFTTGSANLTTKETGQLVTWLLGIKSRSLINDEPEGWLTMNRDFQEWLRQ